MARNEQKDQPMANGAGNTIEQVRELLFGEANRTSADRDRQLQDNIDALRADMLDRFALMEARMSEMERAIEDRHVTTTDEIGLAITEIGEKIRRLALSAGKK